MGLCVFVGEGGGEREGWVGGWVDLTDPVPFVLPPLPVIDIAVLPFADPVAWRRGGWVGGWVS